MKFAIIVIAAVALSGCGKMPPELDGTCVFRGTTIKPCPTQMSSILSSIENTPTPTP